MHQKKPKQTPQQKKEENAKEIQEAMAKKAISKENKGFQMLLKMGYREGSGLGSEGKGIVEPVPVKLKTSRSGLGQEEIIENQKRKREQAFEQEKLKQQKLESEQKANYFDHVSLKYKERQLRKSIKDARIACEKFDREQGIEENPFWLSMKEEEPKDVEQTAEKEEEEEDEANQNPFEQIPLVDQLTLVTEYIREQYHYCIYCGIEFTSKLDLQDNCPGNDKELH